VLAEQDVLGADVGLAQAQRLALREVDRLLGAWGERNLLGRLLLAGADDADDPVPHSLHGDIERLEDVSRQTLLFTEYAEQQVLQPM
jgi:hypothetical protein